MFLEVLGGAVLVTTLPICVAICARIGWYVGGIFTNMLDLWLTRGLQRKYSIGEKTE